jgi:hypothetical protein
VVWSVPAPGARDWLDDEKLEEVELEGLDEPEAEADDETEDEELLPGRGFT